MWYGKYKGLEYLNNICSNDYIVSFRYDYFDIRQSARINQENIIEFIEKNLNSKNIEFLTYYKEGTDNLYMGKI